MHSRIRIIIYMKVALIHDHLMQRGGAEKVLQVLAAMYPDAPIYTLMYDQKVIDDFFPGRRIEASIIQRLPGGKRFYRWFMPFMPMAVEFFDLRPFDLVISSTSSFAKGVITAPDTMHVCYCHTPTRYLWSDTHQYINELSYNKYFKKIISLILNYIRIWDRQAADRVDFFITNSRTSLRRLKKYYRRDAPIVYPSININEFYVSETLGDYYLAGCRLVPYKRIDIVIEAFKELGKPLKIFGNGIDKERLMKLAAGASNIEFLGRISDKEKARVYSECKAFVNPQLEDFGITPLEAMASGRPVIAKNAGGSLENIVEGETGVFFKSESADGIIEAVRKLEAIDIDPDKIREHASRFSQERFKKEIETIIASEYKKYKES